MTPSSSDPIPSKASVGSPHAEYKSDRYRWVILILFCQINLSNALLFGTFAPISDIIQQYFRLGDATAVNMLSSTFLILYPPGSIVGVIALQQYKLRFTMIFAAVLTAFGALIRCVGALLYSEVHAVNSLAAYIIIFFGQCTAALAYPVIMNLPAALAAIYFPADERDLCTTLGSLFNPVGNALGQLLPPLFVSNSSGGSIFTLLLVEMSIGLLTLVLTIIFARDEPPTPPSASTHLKKLNSGHDKEFVDDRKPSVLSKGADSVESSSNETPFGFSVNSNENSCLLSANGLEQERGITDQTKEVVSPKCLTFIILMWEESVRICLRGGNLLRRDSNYVILCCAFALSFGLLNALTAVMNQLLLPYGYSNTVSGLLAVTTISSGIVASFVVGFLMKQTRAYRTILKCGGTGFFITSILFLCALRPNNLAFLLASGVLVGITALPLLPLMMETCAETTYPIPEELSTGLLHNVANIFGTVCIFVLQALMTLPKIGPPPLVPNSLFIIGTTGSCAGLLLAYRGKYMRIGLDCSESGTTPLLNNRSADEQ